MIFYIHSTRCMLLFIEIRADVTAYQFIFMTTGMNIIIIIMS